MTLFDEFETILNKAFEPIQPFLPVLARFLMVVTYLEDSFRICSQWDDQLRYLSSHRGFPFAVAFVFLLVNVAVMLAGSILVIIKRHSDHAVAGLFLVTLIQGLAYGLLFDTTFFFRSLSITGGLVMLLADYYNSNKSKTVFAGIPSMNETDKSTYLQLAGRILLVFLFITFVMTGEFSLLRLLVSIIGLIGCIMIIVGFKAKYSAIFLVTFLSVSNVFLNNWWSLHHLHPKRDFLKYDFFQTLSIVGGFLLLVNLGPGGISVDEKKKNF